MAERNAESGGLVKDALKALLVEAVPELACIGSLPGLVARLEAALAVVEVESATYLTVAQAAARMKVSEWVIRRWVARGLLNEVRTRDAKGNRHGRLVVKREELDAAWDRLALDARHARESGEWGEDESEGVGFDADARLDALGIGLERGGSLEQGSAENGKRQLQPTA